ncbi:hypothetical protein CERSUDRAFT_91982 [Gelatoporia subvermispora B]|uniref:Uncharacterized protein n=1 Tax=Ceriporiopsis subvermispora (strain B) TaxID=914234 RepID=M2PS67_CERS8|nr:hypothetical protein CERSUDRAFT_91982 [Gelatoporia subvermispora B]
MVGLSTNVFAYAGGFTFPLSSIIISHFLLKLRHVVGDRSHETSESQSQPSTVRFASFVDNMGELLDYGFERPDAYGDDMIEDPGAFGSFDLPDPYKEPEVKDDSASIMLVTASENIDTDAIVSLERGVASTCDCGAAM